MMLFLIVTAVLLNSGIVLGANMPHDYVDCPDPTKATSPIAFEKQFQRPGKWFSRIEENIAFPQMGVSVNPITCIIIKDLAKDGKGGYATVDGHVGGHELKINLVSQFGQGLHFSIAVYTQ